MEQNTKVLIKDSKIIEPDFIMVDNDNITITEPSNWIVPLATYKHLHDRVKRSNKVGVYIHTENDRPEDLKSYLEFLPVIGVEFTSPTYGVGYSLAHLIRKRFQFKRDLRALGDFTIDHVDFLKRSGFSSMEIKTKQGLGNLKQHHFQPQYNYQDSFSKSERPLNSE